MVYYLTKKGLEKLKKELEELKTKKIKEVTELLKHAASFGDLKENAEFEDAKERQAWILRRIAQLEEIINTAVVKENNKDEKRVQIGSEVLILLDNKKEKYQLVSPAEVDIFNNKISYQSPLGQKLMNKKEGAEFTFVTNENKKVKVKILEIN